MLVKIRFKLTILHEEIVAGYNRDIPHEHLHAKRHHPANL